MDESNPCPYCGDHMPNRRRVQCGKDDCARAFHRDRTRRRARSMPPCTINQCDYRQRARGLCQSHYRQWRQSNEDAVQAYEYSVDLAECVMCGGTVERKKVNHNACSTDCADAFRRSQTDWSPQNHRRRAKVYGVDAEDIDPTDIAERDGWTCQLCDGPIPRQSKWPHPDSFSLDHIVPLSKGGHHRRENVQASHLACNIRKGDRVHDGAEQLRLVG